MEPTNKLGKTLLGAGLAVALGFALAHSGQALAQGGIWETKAPMPNIKGGGFAGVIDGKFHAGGGGGFAPGNPINEEHYKYDPATDTWTFRAPIPTTRGGRSAVIDRKIYVVGGCFGFDCRINTTNFLESYDPDANSWSTLAPMPTARVSHAVAALDGKLFVVGGVSQCPLCLPQLQTIEVYDPVSNTWDLTPRALMPTGREGASAAAIDGKLYVVGGLVRDPTNQFIFSVTDVVEVYDPVSNTWDITKMPMPTPRANAAVEVIEGKFHVVGGQDFLGGIFAIHEVYDPLTDTWSTLEPMPTARVDPMTGVIDNRLYVAGGSGAAGTLDILEVFTPEPMDHFQCYTAKTPKGEIKFAPIDVNLVDQFGETNKALLKPVMLCVPVDKNGEGIQDPVSHLTCYKSEVFDEDAAEFEPLDVAVNDQFGELILTVEDPKFVCVPSTKEVLE